MYIIWCSDICQQKLKRECPSLVFTVSLGLLISPFSFCSSNFAFPFSFKQRRVFFWMDFNYFPPSNRQ
ncbi:hypothetical protein CW304_07530 [Bacillus sp. UFRGS-B20]|nr:hypothetical protein CW304_07530 [Bacillus sp. UFRGS-B20]